MAVTLEELKKRFKPAVFLDIDELRHIFDGEPITEAYLKSLEADGAFDELRISEKLPACCAGILFRIAPDDRILLMVNQAAIEKKAEDSPSA